MAILLYIVCRLLIENMVKIHDPDFFKEEIKETEIAINNQPQPTDFNSNNPDTPDKDKLSLNQNQLQTNRPLTLPSIPELPQEDHNNI